MKLLKLFSVIPFVVLISGCADKKEIVIKNVYLKSKCSYFEHNITIPKSFPIAFKSKNGKILISKQQFKQLMDNYLLMKGELKKTQEDIYIFNKYIKRINNDK